MQQIKSQQALTEKIASCTKCLEDKLSGNNKKRSVLVCGGTGCLANEAKDILLKLKEEIKKIRYDIANRYLKEKIDYKPNADKVIKYLKEKGYILAIASTTNQPAIDCYKTENQNIINKANLEDYFSVIYAKNDVKAIKPNPEVHDKIMEKLHVKPEECLIVEDALVGVEASNNANIEVAVIYDKYSDSNREKINQLSQYQFKDFDEMLKEMKKELEE